MYRNYKMLNKKIKGFFYNIPYYKDMKEYKTNVTRLDIEL